MLLLPFFLLTVVLTAAAVVRIAGRRIAVGLGAWLAFTLIISASGVLVDFSRRPPPMLVLLAASLVLSTVLALSAIGRKIVTGTPVAWLVGFQAFRILVEIFLDWGAHEGLVPPQMTFEGRNWDILSGLTAIPVAWLAARGSLPRPALLVWNLFGLGLLLNIISVALLSMPSPFQQFTPPNTFVTLPPYIWLPAFLVQAAWFGHLLVFRALSVSSDHGSRYP